MSLGRTGDKTQVEKRLMFEDAKKQMTDALNSKQAPLSFAEAKEAIDGGTRFMVETVVANHGETKEYRGVDYVVAIGDTEYGLDDLDDEAEPEAADLDDDVDEEAAQTTLEDEDEEDAVDPTPEMSTASAPSQPAPWENDDESEVYNLNGLRVVLDEDPRAIAAGEPTGEDWYGLPILQNGHTDTPDEHVDYYPVETTMGVDSENAMGRVLGVMNRPMLWEGESGTGKNRAFDRALAATNRTKQRINFSADLSVFDLVGQKDFDDVGSYFIPGKLSIAVMFGHAALFDEANMVSGNISSFAHAIAEGPGERELELRGTGRTLQDIPVSAEEIRRHGSWYEAARAKWDPDEHLGVYIHPEFRLCATANPLTYASTSQMNGAFRDRFVVMEHEYLSPGEEAKLLAEETVEGIDHDDPSAIEAASKRFEDIVELFHILRESKEETDVPTCPITHRKLVDVVDFAGPDEEFADFADAADQILVKHASTKSDQQYIKDAISDEL